MPCIVCGGEKDYYGNCLNCAKLKETPTNEVEIATVDKIEALEGKTTVKTVFCTECGAKTQTTTKYCRECGALQSYDTTNLSASNLPIATVIATLQNCDMQIAS